MSRQVMIISNAARAPAPSRGCDWSDVTVHHRYYGSSALNGGERIVESRHGERPRALNVGGF
jgi:hypothetical protein